MMATLCVAAHAFCPASTLGGRHLTTRHSRPRHHVLAVAPTLRDEEERVEVAEQNLETFDPSEATPPARDFDSGGYVCPPEKCTWELFQYASPSLRRATVKQFFDAVPKNSLPAMKIWCGALSPPLRPCSRPPPPCTLHLHLHLHLVLLLHLHSATSLRLIGGPSSGKGTIAPMLSQAFRVRTIGVGALLRAEKRVGTPRALACAATMARGELIPDELALEVLSGRLANSPG